LDVSASSFTSADPEATMKACRNAAIVLTSWSLFYLSGNPLAAAESAAIDRGQALRGSLGTFDGEPRGKDGRVDIPRLIAELVEIRANTYHWLIDHAATDWDDLHRFLPLARKRQIRVWVGLAPPAESPPHTKNYSEPFRLDYQRWAAELAKLSLREPNLVAWSIDDFDEDFTPVQMQKILATAREINPKLAFAPCIYFMSVTPRFAARYHALFDGILFPYRHDSGGANLTDASLVADEVQKIKKILGPSVPVIVDVYATAHSALGSTTPEYVRQVMVSAHRSADGVHVYCHQDRGGEKYRIIMELFRQWSAAGQAGKPL
jgi:hypothetical protein